MLTQTMFCINKKFFLLLTFIFLFSGCSLTKLVRPTPKELDNSMNQLSIMLQELNASIDRWEAIDLAKEVILYSNRLSKKYDVVSPPLWHNTLVNIGLKKRGLCYEWVDDLLEYLHQKRYQTLEFYYVGANIDGYFEHNAISVSAKGMGFGDGLLLDAWRGSGNLYFTKIKEDKKYMWENREDIYKLTFPHLKRW